MEQEIESSIVYCVNLGEATIVHHGTRWHYHHHYCHPCSAITLLDPDTDTRFWWGLWHERHGSLRYNVGTDETHRTHTQAVALDTLQPGLRT